MEDKLYRKCFRCGHTLKNEEYMKIGFGKTCLKKVQQEGDRRRLFYLVTGMAKADKENDNGK